MTFDEVRSGPGSGLPRRDALRGGSNYAELNDAELNDAELNDANADLKGDDAEDAD